MERFVPKFQGEDWPAGGARVVHVYAVPDLAAHPELAQLVAACHEAMAAFPVTPMVGTLHCTVEMIADTTSDKITSAEREALVDALHRHLVGTGPVQVTVGSPVANKAGGYLDCYPDDELVALRRHVRDAIQEVRGPGALVHVGGRPHLSLGYAFDTASSDALQAELRRISPSHAPLRIASVELLDVLWCQQPRPGSGPAWELSWEPVASIPLCGDHPAG